MTWAGSFKQNGCKGLWNPQQDVVDSFMQQKVVVNGALATDRFPKAGGKNLNGKENAHNHMSWRLMLPILISPGQTVKQTSQ